MKFYLTIFILLGIFSITGFAQEKSRSQQIEELKKLTSELERIQNQTQIIETKRDEIAAELLGASEKDKQEAERSGAEAVRLFPDGLMDNLIYAPDEVGFSVYSFTEVAEYYFAPRIEFKNNSLQFVKEGEKNLGFIANIGAIPLEALNENINEVAALAKYQPPSKFKDAKSEFVSNNLTFGNKVSVVVGMTYLVRAIRYGEGDAIFALKIQRKDTDGSIILLIKKIQTFDPPKLENTASTEQTRKEDDTSNIPDYETAQKVQNALFQRGFYNVTVEATMKIITLRGSVPKGKMAEAVQAAQEVGKKPVKNELTEK